VTGAQLTPFKAEAELVHPAERPTFVASVILNFVLLAAAIAIIVHPPALDKRLPIIGKEIGLIRVLAVSAVIGIPLLVFRRNRREAYIRGNSVRLSETQFPEIYAILEDQCRRLGMTEVPELFITDSAIKPYSQAYSSWRENYIILHQNIFDVDYRKELDVVAFLLGHELGAIRLGHTEVRNEMLLTYISSIKWLANPLERVRIFSRDRYGAYLAPMGFRGALILAVGRRLLDDVNIEDYLAQMRRYGSIWAFVNTFVEPRPILLLRLQELRKAGFRYVKRGTAA